MRKETVAAAGYDNDNVPANASLSGSRTSRETSMTNQERQPPHCRCEHVCTQYQYEVQYGKFLAGQACDPTVIFIPTHPCKDDTRTSPTIDEILTIIKKQDDEVCGSYGLWEMNSTSCHSFQGNCTLCKITKALELLKKYPEER